MGCVGLTSAILDFLLEVFNKPPKLVRGIDFVPCFEGYPVIPTSAFSFGVHFGVFKPFQRKGTDGLDFRNEITRPFSRVSALRFMKRG